MSDPKLYCITFNYSDIHEEMEEALVVATNQLDAKAHGWLHCNYTEAEDMRGNPLTMFTQLECGETQYDVLSPWSGNPREATPIEYRQAGWHSDSEEPCLHCELYEFGMDEHAVCSECGHCPECANDCRTDPDPCEVLCADCGLAQTSQEIAA